MNTGGSAVAVHPTDHHTPAPALQSFAQRGGEIFLIPNGLGDVVAFGAALLIITLAPFLVHN